MKNTTIILALALMLSMSSFAQDTTKTVVPKVHYPVTNEIGINATDLMKQVLSLSSNNFTLLPYDLTYKLIFKNCAIRIGAGISIANSQESSTSTYVTTGTTTPVQPAPDEIVPTINNSTTFYYRAGWEYRFHLSERFMAYTGVDFIGQCGSTFSQQCEMNNDLPYGYNYNKETDKLTTTAFGGGPVAGIQFFCTKHLSVYTEIPLYFLYTNHKENIDNYEDEWEENYETYTYSFVTTDTKQTNTTKGKAFQLVLPVTVYLSLKF